MKSRFARIALVVCMLAGALTVPATAFASSSKVAKLSTSIQTDDSHYVIGGSYGKTAKVVGTLMARQRNSRGKYVSVAKSGTVVLEKRLFDGATPWTEVPSAYAVNGLYTFFVDARGLYRVRFVGGKALKASSQDFMVQEGGASIGSLRVTDVSLTEDGDYRVGLYCRVSTPAGFITTSSPGYAGYIVVDDADSTAPVEAGWSVTSLHAICAQKVTRDGGVAMSFTVPAESVGTSFTVYPAFIPTTLCTLPAFSENALVFKTADFLPKP